ncbi:MAG: carboxylesterase [Acidimicrobiia bacterium]
MNASVVLDSPAGRVVGQERGGVLMFRGIPYALPPIGRLRFAPTARLEELPLTDGRPFDATRLAPAAPQNTFFGGIELPGLSVRETAEDCLYLNVWTPSLEGKLHPVMVWIHGGGFTTGSGSLPLYKGQRLALEHGVVVVTINYRLGILGFLHLGVRYPQAFPNCFNLGLRDQVLALQWVRENIAAFGGDPNNVTVFGESAGAMSIGTLMGVEEADGLYHKAILQSGASHFVTSPDVAARVCEKVLCELDISERDLGVFYQLDVDEILKAQLILELPAAGTTPQSVAHDGAFLSFVPTIDGDFLECEPLERIHNGNVPNVPLLVGSNLEEFKLFAQRDPAMGSLTKEHVVSRVRQLIPSDPSAAEEVYAAYERAAKTRGASTDPNDLWLAIAADAIFRIPAIRLAEASIATGRKAWVYLFAWKTPLLGAAHGLDVPFVFGNLGGKAAEPFVGPIDKAERLSLAMRKAWTSFAMEGTPKCGSEIEWPPYDQERCVMVFDEVLRVEKDPFSEERRVWDGLL